jgi:hypothetical protein
MANVRFKSAAGGFGSGVGLSGSFNIVFSSEEILQNCFGIELV